MSECACSETDLICEDHRDRHGLRPSTVLAPGESIHIAGPMGGMAACGAPAVGAWRSTVVSAATCRACLGHFALTSQSRERPC